MKILLIYPYCLEDRLRTEDISVVPQGIYYVASVLKTHRYDVEILNWYNINKTPQKISEILQEKKPDIIGLSIVHANRWGGIDIARAAKQIDPGIRIVFGGIGATFLWQHFLTHFPEIDYVVIGEGEYSFLKVIQCIEKKDEHKIKKIKGVAFRKDGKVVRTTPAQAIGSLDEFPNPAKYFIYQHLSLTRGCPGACTFCGSPQFWNRQVRFHSTGYFVDTLERLYQKGITFFYFSDDTFTINKKRVVEICKKILERNLKITWFAISRVDFINEEILHWMRKAGCLQISYGVESGSEKIRKSLNKDISTAQIKEAFSLTVKYGILARAYFIYGCPGESWTTIQETVDLMCEIKPLSVIFYILDIFPGTTLYEDYKRKFNVSDDIWLNRVEDIMYFETDPELSQELILAFGQKLRASFYEKLPAFVKALDLIDDKELYSFHADFYSRLAMTFDHGDYAAVEAIQGKTKVAEDLYNKSISYCPNSRAYLGLGIIKQRNASYEESIQILSKGVDYFPDDEQLNVCLGVSYMNIGAYRKALSHLLPFQQSKQALQHIAYCYDALNDSEKAAEFFGRLHAMP
jgi:radical SAM superfamily enzyme YgiQ (UPF0313 family)